MVVQKTQVHPTWLDYLENSVVGNWGEERVGAFYQIQNLHELSPVERDNRHEIEMMLSTIWEHDILILIYLSWGNLPRRINSLDVPAPFHILIPDATELGLLASRGQSGQMKFSRWAMDKSGVWVRDPMPGLLPIAAAPSVKFSAPSTIPFPPLPPNSAQKTNETIQAFFARRKESNRRNIGKENSTERQRRTQRAEHTKQGGIPNKAGVFFWENQDGHYIRQRANRREFEDLWDDYPGPHRRFDPFHNEWDLCKLFEENDPVFGEGYDHPDVDSDDGMDFELLSFPQNVDMAALLLVMFWLGFKPWLDKPSQAKSLALAWGVRSQSQGLKPREGHGFG
ncbi:hypothetical protein B0H12DRAFT_1239609 [Mycena haematopus]|nr:hypothetical protein B0H12DRAFT_1239609 [Mycena haematopus]